MSHPEPGPGTQQGTGDRPKKRLDSTTWTYIIGILVAIAGIIVVVAVTSRSDPAKATAGDCVDQTGPNEVKVVACDDPKAEFRVLARVENQTETEADGTSCSQYRDQGLTSWFWQGEKGGTGYVLCLAKAAP